MISYSTNYMGPINAKWIEENGSFWAAGRIDVYNDEPFGDEYGLPPMLSRHWYEFTEWLDTFETEEQVSFDEIIKAYPGEIFWYKPDHDLYIIKEDGSSMKAIDLLEDNIYGLPVEFYDSPYTMELKPREY